MDKIRPTEFDPRILADSVAGGHERSLEHSYVPVELLTRVDYDITERGLVLSTGTFIWGFSDIAPYYLRLKSYLSHWVHRINAEIVEVRVASNQFEEMVIASSGLADWQPTTDMMLN